MSETILKVVKRYTKVVEGDETAVLIEHCEGDTYTDLTFSTIGRGAVPKPVFIRINNETMSNLIDGLTEMKKVIAI